MKTLSAQEVKERMEQNPAVKLVMTLGKPAYDKSHIPGSINIWDIELAKKVLSRNAEIIVYCSDQSCMASYYAYQQLEQSGYQKIWRFAGGLVAWNNAGFALESTERIES